MIARHISLCLALVCGALGTTTSLAADRTGCVFNGRGLETISKAAGNAQRFDWQDADHGRRTTRKGDFISLNTWACEHYGAEALLVAHPVTADDREIRLEKARELSAYLVSRADRKAFDGALARAAMAAELPERVDIPETSASEFFIEWRHFEDVLVVFIKFYRD